MKQASLYRVSTLIGALAAFLSLSVVANVAWADKGKCTHTKTAYRTETVGVSTTSSSYVTLPKSFISFKQGGKKADCVVVRVSGVPVAPNLLGMQVVIDGTTIAEPGGIDFTYQTAAYAVPRVFEFVFPNVSPGQHVVRVKWKSGGGNVQMYRRTITVQHR